MKRQEITTGLLPSGYRQLEYLESTGTQYIEFALNVPAHSYFEMDFEFIAKYQYVSNNNYGVFGSSNNNVLSGVYRPESTSSRIVYSSNISGVATSGGYAGYVGKWSRIRFTTAYGNYIWNENLNGEIEYWQNGINRSLTSAISNLRLFGWYYSNNRYPIKIIRNRIIVGDNVVKDLYAALRLSDSKPGLYDLADGIFYTNAGTGEFLYN